MGADTSRQGPFAVPTVPPYTDATDQASDPAAPASGAHRIYSKSGGLYVEDHTGAVTGPLGSGGSGPSDYVSGASGSGHIIIPGLAGSPDIVPASPSAYDDEFTSLSGWSTLGTLDVSNVTDFPSHLHIGNTSIGYAVNGIYKTAPSMPFTVTCKIADAFQGSNFVQVGLLLTDSTPTALVTCGWLWGGYGNSINDFALGLWASRTSRSSNTDTSLQLSPTNITVYPSAIYLRMVVHSSTNVDCLYSYNGHFWNTMYTGKTTGLTVANVGLMVAGNTSGGQVDGLFDYIRFA